MQINQTNSLILRKSNNIMNTSSSSSQKSNTAPPEKREGDVLLSSPPALVRNGPGSNVWTENKDGTISNQCGFVIPANKR